MTAGLFVGRVSAITEMTDREEIAGQVFSIPVFKVRMTVVERFRGDFNDTVDVFTATQSSACGYQFSRDRSYLVYAYRDNTNNRWATGTCSRTRPVEAAVEDLAYLRGPATQPSALGEIVGTATRSDPEPTSVYGELLRRPYSDAPVVVESVGTTTVVRYEAKTGPDGRYAVRVPAGRYRVSLPLPQTLYTHQADAIELLDARGCATQDFTVRSDGRISGRVMYADGSAAAHLQVEIVPARLASQPYFSSMTQVMTDRDGKFEFSRLQPDVYRLGLELRKDPRAASTAIWFLEPPGGPVFDAVLGLEQRLWTREFVLPDTFVTVPVSGVVRDEADRPLAGAGVSIRGKEGRVAGRDVTNAAGEFRLSIRTGIDYTITAERLVAGKWVRTMAQFRAAPGLDPFVLRLSR